MNTPTNGGRVEVAPAPSITGTGPGATATKSVFDGTSAMQPSPKLLGKIARALRGDESAREEDKALINEWAQTFLRDYPEA